MQKMITAILLAASCTLAGGEATRAVTGFVTDSTGRTLAGAIVKVEDPKTLQVRSYRTEATGAYHFAGLGTRQDYKLRAQFRKLSSGDWKWLSRFDSGDPAHLDFQLH